MTSVYAACPSAARAHPFKVWSLGFRAESRDRLGEPRHPLRV